MAAFIYNAAMTDEKLPRKLPELRGPSNVTLGDAGGSAAPARLLTLGRRHRLTRFPIDSAATDGRILVDSHNVDSHILVRQALSSKSIVQP